MKLSFLHCVYLFFAFVASLSFAPVEYPKISEDPQCAASLLLLVREVIPSVFEEGAEYDVNLMTFLEKNRGIIEYISEHPSFKRLAHARGPRITIQIQQKPNRKSPHETGHNLPTVIENRIAEYFWDSQGSSPTRNNFNQLSQELLQTSQAIGKKTSVGIATALALQLHNVQERAKVLGFQDPLYIVKYVQNKNLDYAAFQQRFRFANYGLAPENYPGWDHFAGLIQQTISLEEQLVARYVPLYHYSNREKDSPKELSFGQFYVALKEASAHVDDLLHADRNFLTSWKESEVALLHRQLRSILKIAKTTTKSVEQPESYTLVEVPPLLGALRGLVGGDCSSEGSFAYAYLPQEHTFFIYDSSHDLLGYAMLTDLAVRPEGKREKPGWYLHDITGRRLSPAVAETILHGLYLAGQQKKRRLVLPTPEAIGEINNHKALIELQQGMVKDTEAVELVYDDAPLRDTLGESEVEINDQYDSSSNNTEGRDPFVRESLLEKLNVTVRGATPFALNKTPPRITPEDAVLLSLALLTAERLSSSQLALKYDIEQIALGDINTNNSQPYSARRAAAKAIAKLGEIDFSALSALNEALANPSKDTLAGYYARVEKLFSKLGIESIPSLQKNHPYLFYEGHLRSKDLFRDPTPASKRTTIDYALRVLRQWPIPQLAISTIAQNPKVFEESTRFQNLVRRFLERVEDNRTKLLELNRVGISFRFLTPEERTRLEELLK